MMRLKKYPFIVLLCIFILQAFPVKAAVKEVKYQAEINYPPLKYMNNGHLSGFDVELTNLIFKNEDYRLLISTDNWDTIYERLKSGDIDTCGFIVVNDERRKDVLFSDTVMDTHIGIYTRNDFQKVSLKDLNKYFVGVGKAQYSESILKNDLKISDYNRFDNVEQAVDALANGQIDVLFENQEVVNHYIINKGLKGIIVPQASDLFPQKIAYGVKKSNTELVKYINDRLKQLQKSGAYEELYQKYFFSHSDIYLHKQKERYFILIASLFIALVLLHIISQFYIRYLKRKVTTERMQYENKLQAQYMELEATHEELMATEEELRAQYDELMENQQLLEESENRYKTILESTSDGIWELDTKANKLFISKRFADMLGIEQQAFHDSKDPSKDWYDLLHPEDKEFVFKKYRDQEELELDTIQFESRMKRNDGSYKWFLSKSKNLKDANGNIYKKIGSITDIDGLKMYEQQLHYNAYYDTLTGLPNRLYLYENVAPEICKSITNNQKGALLFIDVDNFKIINDTFGHSIGDMLLIQTAERLWKVCPGKNNIIRLGGDEFIILLSNIDSIESVEIAAKELIKTCNETFSLGELIVTSTLSIGICIFPKDGDNLGILLKNADTAMYRSKNSGRNGFTFYEESMSKNLIDKINLENNLKMALRNDEFKLHYQPQLDLNTGKIAGLEALIRWNNPQLGRIPPDKFIAAAEEMGLIIPIGEWVLKTACEFLVKLHNEGFPNLRMSVNISIVQLIQNNFPDIVLRILNESGLDAKYLELEITETVLMENIGVNIEKLELLTSKGLSVALDDFGKGYSSLNYLKSLPISTLKIDKSFMDDVLTDSYTEAIVSSVMLIGNKMGLTIVAEGIEEAEQLEYLKYSGCNLMQGYLLSRPLPEEELIDFLS